MLKNDKGWTLAETVGYLIIMATITIGALYGYVGAYFKYKTIKMDEIVVHTAVNIQSAYMQYSDYGNLDTANALKQHYISSSAKISENGIPLHLQDGKIEIFADSLEKDANDRSAFVIRFYNLDSKMCTALATEPWENNKNSGIVAMEIRANPDYQELNTLPLFHYCDGIDADLFAGDNHGYALVCMHGQRQDFPLHPSRAARACNCTEKTCMITWKYK
ncbi:MAG: hypothetical protein J6039_04235 [Alphaproteobacteria bacterium]|nr:hypothetical protein [Alphaproteobacteria bacterium]